MKKINKYEMGFILSGLFMLLLVIGGSVYALRFLSVYLVQALSFDYNRTEEFRFNIEEFNELGL